MAHWFKYGRHVLFNKATSDAIKVSLSSPAFAAVIIHQGGNLSKLTPSPVKSRGIILNGGDTSGFLVIEVMHCFLLLSDWQFYYGEGPHAG
jgi:hypothetical protein